MTIKPEEITASLRRMADVETSILYSQRTTLIGAADEIERLRAENAKYKDLYRVQSGQMIELMAENSALIQRLAPIVMGRGSNRDTIAAKSQNIFAQTLSVDNNGDIMGTGPASYRIADLLTNAVAEARNKALDDACQLIETITRDVLKDSEGVSPPDYFDEGTSAAYEAIRALKDSAP